MGSAGALSPSLRKRHDDTDCFQPKSLTTKLLKFFYKLFYDVAPHLLAAAIFLVSHVDITLKMNQLTHGESLLKDLNNLWLIVFD